MSWDSLSWKTAAAAYHADHSNPDIREHCTDKVFNQRNGQEANANGHEVAKPLLIINSGDLTATAKELAGLFVADGPFLSNGNAPGLISVDDDMPRAPQAADDHRRAIAHQGS